MTTVKKVVKKSVDKKDIPPVVVKAKVKVKIGGNIKKGK